MFSLLQDMRAVALFLASTLTILSNILISPALPAIEQAFSDTENVELIVRMLVTAPSLLVAIFAPFAGALADRFGRRRQLLIGMFLFAIAGSAGLWLNSLTAILISRLLLGIAVAFVMTAQISLIGVYFSGALRARFMGMQMAITNLSGLFFVLFALGFVGFANANELWAVLGSAIIVGGAAGLLIPIFISFGLDIAPLARRGFASGILTSAVFMGQFLSPIASHSLILEVGYKTTFGLTAAMFSFLACVAHFVFRVRPMAQYQPN